MQNYNFAQRLLHHLALGSRLVKTSLYEVEKLIYLKDSEADISAEQHVFVTGLPRAGTTALLNFLYASDEFHSLTYNHMPFIMAPNFSSLFSARKTTPPKRERFHQDGIFFNLDSPEAFDEVFFSSFSTEEISEELPGYLQLILLKKSQRRYLSKNNGNYKRIDLLQSILPEAFFLLPIREPLQHANSLLSQHRHFSELQRSEDFIRRYMTYLGHREFGLDHLPWHKPEKYKDSQQLNYWLEQWIMFYDRLQAQHKTTRNCLFLKYEDLTNRAIIERLTTTLEITPPQGFAFKLSQKTVKENYDSGLYKRALEIYEGFESGPSSRPL